MSSIRRLIFVVAILGTTVATISLGFWQLRRLAARRANNAALHAAGIRAPLRLPEDATPVMTIDSGRRIVARGHFDPRDQVLLRGRVQDEEPGLQVATAFRIDSLDTVLWVLRGFVASPDATTPPEIIAPPDSGDVTIAGLALAIPVVGDSGRPLHRGSITTWQRLDRATLIQRRPSSLGVYLLLTGTSAGPGRLPVVPPPVLDNGPHLSYAIQWFGIALAVFVFGVIFLRQDGRGSARRPGAP